MTESDKAALKTQLQDRLAELDLEDGRGADGQKTVTLDQQAVGRLSRMDALQQQAMARATQGRRSAERARIASTLARIDKAYFGLCTDCDEPIALARLKLNPTLTLCVDCAN
ncbi:MAG: TraR/DksA C4-type zinc finger protein [Pseudomonadota bacterium]